MSEKLDVIYVSYSGDFILFAGWDNAVHQFLSGFCEGPKLFEIAECFILFARGVSPPSGFYSNILVSVTEELFCSVMGR